MSNKPIQVVIIGAGFAGLNAAKELGGKPGVKVLLIDRRNYHLFQPLLYQVAMAGLSPADIATPIRSLLSKFDNIEVIQGNVTKVDPQAQTVSGDFGDASYDTLIMACGAKHAYFGHEEWEPYAPGLKSLEQATEIRRRVLTAFELAERETDGQRRRELLTFVIVGGGPTGLELAGAIGEMSRFTLARDFKRIDPKLTRVVLIEAGRRILPQFDEKLASRATRDLEALGVQVWTESVVTNVDAKGVTVGKNGERIAAATVVWAAGVRASSLGQTIPCERDRSGRVHVGDDLSLAQYPNIFVAGDQAHALDANGAPLPGVAPVAIQQGKFIGKAILKEIKGKPRGAFKFFNKGSMATIGRSRAIAQSAGGTRMTGMLAWLAWLFVHVYYLSSFRNRFFVVLAWGWSYLTFSRGARLIVHKSWRSYGHAAAAIPQTQSVAAIPVLASGGEGAPAPDAEIENAPAIEMEEEHDELADHSRPHHSVPLQ